MRRAKFPFSMSTFLVEEYDALLTNIRSEFDEENIGMLKFEGIIPKGMLWLNDICNIPLILSKDWVDIVALYLVILMLSQF